MDAAQIVVTVVGLLLIAGVAWFFFGEQRKSGQNGHKNDR